MDPQEAFNIREDVRKLKEEAGKQRTRLDKQEERIDAISLVVESVQDDGSLSGGSGKKRTQQKKAPKVAAKSKLPPPMWTQEYGAASSVAAKATGGGGYVTPKAKTKGTVHTDNVFKGNAARQWDMWGSTLQMGPRNIGTAAKAQQSPDTQRNAASSTQPGRATPPKFTNAAPPGLPRPVARAIAPLQFHGNTGQETAASTVSPPANSCLDQAPAPVHKRMRYGNPPLKPCIPTDGMHYFNADAPVKPFPLYDKEPVLVGKYGLRAFRMSGGGCIATFDVVNRADGTRELLPISSQLIQGQMDHRMRYLESHGVGTKFIQQPSSEEGWHFLRLTKVARDVLLMHMSLVLAGCTNDRPFFLTKPVPELEDGSSQPLASYMDRCPEPVRTLMVLVTRGGRMEQLDQANQTKLVKDLLTAARRMVHPLRNGFPDVAFAEPMGNGGDRGSFSDEF